jgi:hypothetical protein
MLQTMRENGMTCQEIADELAARGTCFVTAKAVNMALLRGGYDKVQPRYTELLPWKLAAEHHHAHDANMLRLAGREANGRKMTQPERRMYDRWLEQLTAAGAVVHYTRETGFVWVKARPGIDTGLIRVPKKNERTGTTLDPAGT